ncbi:MAG TPA: hypothetical protein VLA19_22535, partial [Herpetosiphonaceae bacterium]|nr:hypothetical protein [Herpetosiphonaceae bacterium]
LLHRWQGEYADTPPASIAAALESAAYCLQHARAKQTLELAWTGPTSSLPLRRTSQALQQLIDSALRDLLIVSYAVYSTFR